MGKLINCLTLLYYDFFQSVFSLLQLEDSKNTFCHAVCVIIK